MSRGRYVAIQGSGDISMPDRIARQAAILDERTEIGIVGCHVENERNAGSSSVVIRPQQLATLQEALAAGNPFTHGEVMFRRAIYDYVGGYRTVFSFAQDRDLWFRMARRTSYYIIPDVLYQRRKFGNSISADPYRIVQQYVFSDLAVQANAGADAEGRDIVDRYGHAALLVRSRSKLVASKSAYLAMRLLLHGREREAIDIAELGWREGMTRSSLVAKLTVTAARVAPRLWRSLLLPVLRRYMAKRPSYHW